MNVLMNIFWEGVLDPEYGIMMKMTVHSQKEIIVNITEN